LKDILAAPIERRLSKIAHSGLLRRRPNRGTIWLVYRCFLELLERILVMTAVEKSTVMAIAPAADLTLGTVAGRMKSMVTDRPLVTIGIAAGIGILLSFLWRPQAHGQFRGRPSEGGSYRP
jgi:hypothetical protein